MDRSPVIVATALDEGSDHAISQAAAVARSTGVALHICHVLPESYGFQPLFPHLRELERSQFEQMRKTVERAIDEQVRRVVPDHPAIKVSIETGSPHAGILRLAEQVKPRLIVMGVSPGKPQGVTERVVRYAPCPVLLAARHHGKIVLAATDFSDPALPAIHAGVEEAHRRGLPCHVLHAVEFPTVPVHWTRPDGGAIANELLDAMRVEARQRLDQLSGQFTPPVQTILADGPASDAILTKADELDAELIVIGTHGRSGLQRLAFGSVAESTVRRSRCSVLVVRLTS